MRAKVRYVALSSGRSEVGQERRERLVTIFSALSDATRMEMLELIIRRGEVACAEFDDRFPLSKSTISYHTKILHAAGLIETRREGRFFHYRPTVAALNEELPGFVERIKSAS